MRVLMFQPRFARLVESGQKTQTIRAKARCNPGDTLSLREWTGKPYRSKQRVIREARCRGVEPITIGYAGMVPGYKFDGEWCVNHVLRDDLAKRDGFQHFHEMLDWMKATHGLPFEGELITWEATK
jgi:hypothetical protein